MSGLRQEPEAILARLRELRAADAPTHGGRVLSYVYDPDDERLDALAADAIRIMQPVNWLDPLAFPSAAAIERETLAFVRDLVHGGDEVVGSLTSGGTVSCLLAVLAAREAWRAARPSDDATRPRLLAPVTVHAAFHKAAKYFGLDLDLVPVDAAGRVDRDEWAARLGPDVALAVASAPAYPHAVLDPIAALAQSAAAARVPLHVDACVGGMALPFWPGLPDWDFRVPGVMSMSIDLHKFGYAPKGVSVVLHRGRERHRRQFFATRAWPGYPVVNPTLLGSRSPAAAAAGWALIQALGVDGYRERADAARRATDALVAAVRGIRGLRVVGEPVGPMLAVALDPDVPEADRVSPHLWADAVARRGFVLQPQPGLEQPGRAPLPRTTHLTVTPVTERVLGELVPALEAAAAEVRGRSPVDGAGVLAGLATPDDAGAAVAAVLDGAITGRAPLDSDSAAILLRAFGVHPGAALPDDAAPLLAAVEALPQHIAERLLVEVLARAAEPRAPGGGLDQ